MRDHIYLHLFNKNSFKIIFFPFKKYSLILGFFYSCSCGREEDIEDFFDCVDCSVYGLCGFCVTKMHRKHDIKDCVKSTIFSVVNDRSEQTLKKLAVWTTEAQKLNKEVQKACESLKYHLNFNCNLKIF